jgi:hypothetical protein
MFQNIEYKIQRLPLLSRYGKKRSSFGKGGSSVGPHQVSKVSAPHTKSAPDGVSWKAEVIAFLGLRKAQSSGVVCIDISLVFLASHLARRGSLKLST